MSETKNELDEYDSPSFRGHSDAVIAGMSDALKTLVGFVATAITIWVSYKISITWFNGFTFWVDYLLGMIFIICLIGAGVSVLLGVLQTLFLFCISLYYRWAVRNGKTPTDGDEWLVKIDYSTFAFRIIEAKGKVYDIEDQVALRHLRNKHGNKKMNHYQWLKHLHEIEKILRYSKTP